jgi:hypothetical protein
MERFFVAGEGPDAAVLWRPELCPHVLRLHAVPAPGAGLDLGNLLLLPHFSAGVIDDGHDDHGDGRHVADGDDGGDRHADGGDHHRRLVHLLYRDGRRQLQLEISGMIGGGKLLLLEAVIDRRILGQQLRALRAFNALLSVGRLPPYYDRPASRGRRLALIRAALDASVAGRPQREIAIAMFGAARVERDWAHPAEHCRDQVRRAVARGRRLMEGGYRALLR